MGFRGSISDTAKKISITIVQYGLEAPPVFSVKRTTKTPVHIQIAIPINFG